MKKSDFVSLVVGVVGGLLFSIGMCMCLLPEWNAFTAGVVLAAIGGVMLLVLVIARCAKSGKKLHINWKLTGKIAFGTLGALVLGVGMCMVLVWEMMLLGVAIGVVGIVLLLCLIPMCVGLK